MKIPSNARFELVVTLLAVGIVIMLCLFAEVPSGLAVSNNAESNSSINDFPTSQAWVTMYDDEGGYTDVTYVGFGNDIGYNTELSPYVGHVVDITNNSYVLNWRPNNTGPTFQLCGLRVAYRLPLGGGGFAPDFSYAHVAGSVLRPRHSSSEYANDPSGGCIYVTSGLSSRVFNIHLNVPEGSRIDYLRVFYYREAEMFLPVIKK